jgi:penicillin-binding protein 1A
MDINKKTKRNLTIFWSLFSLPFIAIIAIFILIAAGTLGPMPTFEQLENPQNNLASEVYSSDNKLLGKYYLQNRSSIDFEGLSPNIVNALIAIEDIRFKKHSGIDPIGLGRVLVKTILLGQEAGGGSTITQQLAKNLFGRDTSTFNTKFGRAMHLCITKFKEWVTAVRLERNYTKKEILVMYLNTVFFGSHSYGIKSASKTFFNTTPDSLRVEEAALLAGVVNAPTRYNPILNPKAALARRNTVLSQMHKYDILRKKQYDSLKQLPLNLNYNVDDQLIGQAPYLREYIRLIMNADKPKRKDYSNYKSYRKDSIRWLNDPLYGWLAKNKKPDGKPYNLYTDGLRIYTTIDSKMQEYAKKAVQNHLTHLQKTFFEVQEGNPNAPFSDDLEPEQIEGIMDRAIKRSRRYWSLKRKGVSQKEIMAAFNKPVKMKIFTWQGEKDTLMSPIDSIKYYKYMLRVGFMSMNPHNGHIKAYIGGPDFKYFKYDHVIVGRRQVGSTIKPFLYTLAVQEGISPCKKVPNVQQTFTFKDTVWAPKNAGASKMDGEMVTLKWGLVNSVNSISAWLVKQFNPQSVVDIMHKMGIESDVLAVPSIILGTSDLSVYEMVGAYGSYVNKGVHIKPTFITHIKDKNGNEITEFHAREKEGISERTAYTMIKLLQGVVDQGTAVRLRLTYDLYNEIAGKTGTTQNQSDGWFMGVVPNLVSGVWVGFENRSVHFDDISIGQGANMALPVWAEFIKQVYNDKTIDVSPVDTFTPPPGFDISVNCKDMEDEEEVSYEIMDNNF